MMAPSQAIVKHPLLGLLHIYATILGAMLLLTCYRLLWSSTGTEPLAALALGLFSLRFPGPRISTWTTRELQKHG